MSFNINAILTFTSKGVEKTFKGASGAFNKMSSAGQKLSAGVSKASIGTAALAVPASLATAGFVSAVKVAAKFEKQMSVVKSLAKGTAEEFVAMENEAKRLGATTAFSANQAAQGLEFLALAGFNAKESTEVLNTILNTAAAGSLDLGRASDIVTDSMSALTQAFGKNEPVVSKATKLSDMMALAQARSNTNIEQLGEAIKFGGGTLAAFGVPLEQIIGSMGKLADAGLKGSAGGTAMVNMFSKLAKPSEKSIKLMNEAGISFDEIQSSLKNPLKLLPILQKIIGNVDPDGRGAAGIEMFGIRGVRAFNALNAAGPEALKNLATELSGASKMTDEFGNVLGASTLIAKKRTENFEGQLIALKSAYEGLNIEIGNLFIKGKDSALPILRMVVKGVQDITAAFQVASGNVSAFGKPLEELTPTQKSLIEFAKGFREGISEVFDVAKTTFNSISKWLKDTLGDGENSNKELGKMVAKFITFGAIAGPILVAIAAGLFILGPIIGSISSAIGLIGGILGLVGKAFSGLVWIIVNKSLIATKSVMLFTKSIAAIKAVAGFIATKFTVFTGIATKAFAFAKTAAAGFFGLITAKAVLIAGVFLAIGAGIYGIVKRWDQVKAAFAKGFLPGMLELAKSFGLGIWDALKWPFEKAKSLFNSAKSFLGFGSDEEDTKEINKNITKNIIPPSMEQQEQPLAKILQFPSNQTPMASMSQPQNKVVGDLNQEVLKQKRLAQPMSSSQDVIQPQSMKNAANDFGSGGSQQKIEVNSNIKLELDGREVARAVARNTVDNNERLGIKNSAGEKRKMLERGAISK